MLTEEKNGTGKRVKISLNNRWKFMYGDVKGAMGMDFDDLGWYDIGLPHSYGIPYFMENEFYVGYGCYRRHLFVEEAWAGKQISLEFQGVFQKAEVYVNGRLAGEHKGGYTAFEIPITAYLREGDNLLGIRVNNLWDARLAPRAGEHVFNGGIYRDVNLIVTGPVHVAWYGTAVTTPAVSEKEAEISLQTTVVNESGRAALVKLASSLQKDGEEFFVMSSTGCLEAGGMLCIRQEGTLDNPKLWHPDTPELYQFYSQLYVDGELADEYETDFGIRWFSFTPDKGFFLNGKHYLIHGTNVHQDHAGWSDAVTHTGIMRDVRMIKDCGMNFIRGSHYPHHTYFAEACDRMGVLLWSENCFWGTGGPNEDGYWTASAYPVREEDEEEFEESCLRTLEEMIHTNRNHPSIIVWSMCNEPFFSDIRVMDKAKELVKKLVQRSHDLDPSRPAAVGGVQRGGFDRLGDLAGYNGDGAAIFIDPGIPNFVSEYGSIVADRPGEYRNRYRDGVEADYSWRSGKALWCGFHHGSIFGDMGHMGMVDYYRLPLDVWYWYRKELMGIEPPPKPVEGVPAALRLMPDRESVSSDGTEDVHVVVAVVDAQGRRVNADPDILLEVVSGGGIFPTGKAFLFSARKGNLAEGMGAIEFRSYYAGDTVIRAGARGLEGAEITVHVSGEDVWVDEKINLPHPPPFVTGTPIREQTSDIGKNRPVFCSSGSEENPARNVTDGDYGTCWKPCADTFGEWVLVDLEGTKEVREVCVVFGQVTNVLYEIALSDDRKHYRTIYQSGREDYNSFVSLPLEYTKTRYVRVLFPKEAEAVVRIIINA